MLEICFIISLVFFIMFFSFSICENWSKKSLERHVRQFKVSKFISLILAGAVIIFGYRISGQPTNTVFNFILTAVESVYDAIKLFFISFVFGI